MVQKTVIAAVDDIFFTAKIRAVAAHTGANLHLTRSLQATINSAREKKAELVIVDLHAQTFDPLSLARLLKADEELSRVILLGFFSHVQTALMRQAQEAGYDLVLPRSSFTNRLPEILAGTFKSTREG